jgi:hydroxymethylpyrimidine/phosphomethylpyrimidine kinase
VESVLTIAGSDSSGGAGIQADIKTIEANGLFATSAITALTAQNTTGVSGVLEVPPDFVVQQIEAVFNDIPPAAVKIGMVYSEDCAYAIARALKAAGACNVVVDPVMVATSGAALSEGSAAFAVADALFEQSCVITPNIPEACAEKIAARVERRFWQTSPSANVPAKVPYILIKGGHGLVEDGSMRDLLRAPDGTIDWIDGRFVDTANTHGTGCTLSSAIACGLARGLDVPEAVVAAKRYIEGALSAGLNLGKSSGPLDHMWAFR